jgi:hypothetical protein
LYICMSPCGRPHSLYSPTKEIGPRRTVDTNVSIVH